ncbi:MAG: hypothetical protein ABI396_04775 [Ktedonobacteraceae bacterium]
MIMFANGDGEKEMFKKNLKHPQTQYIFIPAYTDVLPESMRRLPIVTQVAPDQICGVAHRVGWVGEGSSRQAIYRLKLRLEFASYGTAILPGFYILENDIFVEHRQPDVCEDSDNK